MNHDLPPITLDRLLAHAGWVRGLARSLVADEQWAEDVVQETYLAALRHPPRGPARLRAWLGKVVRSRAFHLTRRDRRRAAREQAVGEGKPQAGPDEIVTKVQLHRRVTDCVLELREPYRSTILLRFFEELDVPAIAIRHEVAEATVRTRLRRGLEQLRERLDQRYGGRRESWLAALAPLVPESVAPLPGVSLAAAAVVVTTVGLGLYWWWPGPSGPATGGDRPAPLVASGPGATASFAKQVEATREPVVTIPEPTVGKEPAESLPEPAEVDPSAIPGLLARATRIEITVLRIDVMPWGSINYPQPPVQTLTDPGEVRRIATVAAACYRPLDMAMALIWPNRVEFVLDDGRRVETSVAEGTFFVGGQPDSRLSSELENALRPHLERARMAAARNSGVVTSGAEIEALDVNARIVIGYGLVDDDLRHLSRLSALSLLDLHYCSKTLTDAGLIHLAGLRSLTELKLAWNRTLTGRTLAGIDSLVTIDLSRAEALDVAGFRALAELPRLEQLDLDSSPCLNDRGMEVLSRSRSLRTLDLTRCRKLSADGLVQVGRIRSLVDLDLSDCEQVDQTVLQAVAALPALERLELDHCSLDNIEALTALTDCASLRELDLSGNRALPAAALQAISSLTDLERLDLQSCEGLAHGAGVHLSRLRSLRELDVNFTRMSDDDLRQLVALQALETLDIGFTALTDEGMADLIEALPKLTDLSCYACRQLTDACLDSLAAAPRLKNIHLDEDQFSTDALEPLRNRLR